MELGYPFISAKNGKKEKIFKKFGVGVKFDSKDPQDLFAEPVEEDDLSDYAIDS